MTEPRIAALIVDLDGAIRHWHNHELLEQAGLSGAAAAS
jgi:hypothetical protein